MGIAFDNVRSKEEGMAYFPTVSLSIGEKCLMNFGAIPFVYPVDGYQPLDSCGEIIHNQSVYLVNCISKLIPYLNSSKCKDKKSLSKDNNNNSSSKSFDELSFNDVLIFFANIFEFYAPLLSSYKAAVRPFVELLIKLDNTSLFNLFDIITLCFRNEDESNQFITNLLLEISYKAHTSSWIPPSNGSINYLKLSFNLLKIDFISNFLGDNFNIFSNWFEELLDTKYPSHKDLQEIFPSTKDEFLSEDENKLESVKNIDNLMNQKRQIELDIFKYLIEIPDYFSLNGILIKFIKTMINRNEISNRNIRIRRLLTNPTCLLNIYITLIHYLEDFLKDFDNHPNAIQLFSSDTYKHSNRVGGTLSYLKKKYPVDTTNTDDIDKNIQSKWELLEYVLLLSHFGVGKILNRAGDRLVAYLETKKQLEKGESESSPLSPMLKDKLISQIRYCYWDSVFWIPFKFMNHSWNLITKVSSFLHNIQNETIFKYVPEFYLEVVCDTFYYIRRGTNPRFEFTTDENKNQLSICVSILINSIDNKDIINPGL